MVIFFNIYFFVYEAGFNPPIPPFKAAYRFTGFDPDIFCLLKSLLFNKDPTGGTAEATTIETILPQISVGNKWCSFASTGLCKKQKVYLFFLKKNTTST